MTAVFGTHPQFFKKKKLGFEPKPTHLFGQCHEICSFFSDGFPKRNLSAHRNKNNHCIVKSPIVTIMVTTPKLKIRLKFD